MCHPCDPGSYNSLNGSTSPANCTACPVGTASTGNFRNCVDCKQGEFAAAMGKSMCDLCPSGTANPNFGSPSADDCQECQGFRTPVGAASCIECEAGKYFVTENAIDKCWNCPRGKIAPESGAVLCSPCPTGKRAISKTRCEPCPWGRNLVDGVCECGRGEVAWGPENSFCKPLLTCDGMSEYLDGEVCKKCNVNVSLLKLFLSVLSFVALVYYIKDKVKHKASMVGVKCTTTFVQCAQLTTLIDIPWPRIALWVPFTIPDSSLDCIKPATWDQEKAFFTYFYLALAYVVSLAFELKFQLPGSHAHHAKFQQGIFFVVLMYAPLVQNAAAMLPCIEDAEHGLVLRSAPNISCEPSAMRAAAQAHAYIIISFIGFGLPAAIVWKMRQLRHRGELDGSSAFSELFEWYSLKTPYWEAVVLVKKLLLILASDSFFTDPRTQATAVFCVHLMYLALSEWKLPMPFHPSTSSLFKGQNFFHLVERSAALTSLVGSILALTGGFNQPAARACGIAFAVLNMSYVTVVIYSFVYSKDVSELTKLTELTDVGGGVFWERSSQWDEQVQHLEEAEELTPEDAEQMRQELMFLRSKIIATVTEKLNHAIENLTDPEDIVAAFGQADDLIAQINTDTARMYGETVEPIGRASDMC
ncbi:hypothetical protein TeGR_g11541 [Tetraparma gracilis]|uniref:Tyrosine-protein kinase ephrin type A/B receptor-like domain-containing protein n=1 Tax=Tetraparma gracilis TaxID=2962635 RepID=A0ABQ6N034_9STRA|nr:hypothetical protein TeGR_g11541 [Tetraparma gracilis]